MYNGGVNCSALLLLEDDLRSAITHDNTLLIRHGEAVEKGSFIMTSKLLRRRKAVNSAVYSHRLRSTCPPLNARQGWLRPSSPTTSVSATASTPSETVCGPRGRCSHCTTETFRSTPCWYRRPLAPCRRQRLPWTTLRLRRNFRLWQCSVGARAIGLPPTTHAVGEYGQGRPLDGNVLLPIPRSYALGRDGGRRPRRVSRTPTLVRRHSCSCTTSALA